MHKYPRALCAPAWRSREFPWGKELGGSELRREKETLTAGGVLGLGNTAPPSFPGPALSLPVWWGPAGGGPPSSPLHIWSGEGQKPGEDSAERRL